MWIQKGDFENLVKSPNVWKLSNTFLNNPWVPKEIMVKKKNALNQITMKMLHIKMYAHR